MFIGNKITAWITVIAISYSITWQIDTDKAYIVILWFDFITDKKSLFFTVT